MLYRPRAAADIQYIRLQYLGLRNVMPTFNVTGLCALCCFLYSFRINHIPTNIKNNKVVLDTVRQCFFSVQRNV